MARHNKNRSQPPVYADFAALAYGTVYRLTGVFHFWNGNNWSGAGGVKAGVYVGQEPVTGRHLFNDSDVTYGVADTVPMTTRLVKLRYVGVE